MGVTITVQPKLVIRDSSLSIYASELLELATDHPSLGFKERVTKQGTLELVAKNVPAQLANLLFITCDVRPFALRRLSNVVIN